MIFKHLIYGDFCVSEKKCGFLTFNIMWATKNIKLNVSYPCLNERTSKELFAETTKGDIKFKEFI